MHGFLKLPGAPIGYIQLQYEQHPQVSPAYQESGIALLKPSQSQNQHFDRFHWNSFHTFLSIVCLCHIMAAVGKLIKFGCAANNSFRETYFWWRWERHPSGGSLGCTGWMARSSFPNPFSSVNAALPKQCHRSINLTEKATKGTALSFAAWEDHPTPRRLPVQHGSKLPRIAWWHNPTGPMR